MKIVNILGINYEILQVKPQDAVKHFEETSHYEEVKRLIGENGENFAGLCDAQSCKIFINVDLPLEKKKKTLIHEIVEALDQESITELDHVVMQAITNAFFISGIIDIEELLKIEPEDIEISIDSNSA